MRDSSSIQEVQSGLIRFLASPAIANGFGSIYSWVNPEHPGFVYPEAMGLYVRLISQIAASRSDRALADRARVVAEGLESMTPPLGGFGMDGKLYLFDTCMAVGGLVAYRRLLGGRVDDGKLASMGRFIADMTKRRLALVSESGDPVKAPHHWSTIFGAHMLKTVIALNSLAEETGDAAYRSLALEVADEVLSGCLRDGKFRIGPQDSVVYCHAHCYALEGLLYLRTKGLRDETKVLKAGAESLRAWQNPDGSMFNWYEDPARTRSKVGDATSQTVRIWLAVDREAHLPAIEKGLEFLSRIRSPQSGIYYCEGSRDVNSISSVFAAQAMEWYLRGPQPEWLA